MFSNQLTTLPVYAKACITLLLITLIGWLLYIGSNILVPLGFAILVAILLLPITSYLEKKKIKREIAILISITASVIFFSGLIYFLASQVLAFLQDVPTIKKQLLHHFANIQAWMSSHFHLTRSEQMNILSDATNDFKPSSLIGDTVLSLTQVLSVLVLLPVYIFLLLYYRDMIYIFFLRIFGEENKSRVVEVLRESRSIVQGYMTGLLVELAIVAAINSAGLLVLGIRYAIFLGVFAAILNMIPYVGMLIAGIFCSLVTLTTSNYFGDVVGVIVILTVVQFIDNNIIMPRVVSSKMRINALMAILGVLVGGALAGIPGMFLSIPAIAILKVIFDRVEGLESWGLLLGYEMPTRKKISFKKKKPLIKENTLEEQNKENTEMTAVTSP